MNVVSYSPQKPFDSFFRECYYIHINKEKANRRIPVIDDCCYDFVFFKEAKGVFYFGVEHDSVPIRSKVFTIHDVTPPYRFEAAESLTFFTIKLQPWTNAYFFSILKESGVVDIGDFNTNLISFHEQIFRTHKVEEKFTLADKLMTQNMPELTSSMALVRDLCEYIYAKQGKVTVNELSHQFERSRQYLGKTFKKEVMYSLKRFIITVRILDLVKFKQRNPDVSLTELCYQYGYFDQPHFINDFKRVCGIPPLEFFNNLPEFMLRHQ